MSCECVQQHASVAVGREVHSAHRAAVQTDLEGEVTTHQRLLTDSRLLAEVLTQTLDDALNDTCQSTIVSPLYISHSNAG